MAVQIPRLPQMGPTAPDSVGRITATPDNSAAIKEVGAVGQGLSNIAQTANKVMSDFEEQQAELTGTAAASQFEIQKRRRLAEAKNWDGDPTEVYAKIEQDSKQWESDILDKYSNASDYTKNVIRQKITKRNYDLQEQAATSEAIQHDAWDKNQTDLSVKLGQDNALGFIDHVSAKDPTSFAKWQSAMDSFQGERIERGKRQGLVTTDADGNDKYSPILLQQMRKERSDSIRDAVNTLNSTGKTDEAKYIMDNYSDVLVADDRVKLSKGLNDAEVKKEAYKIFDQVRTSSDPFAKLSKMTLDPEVRTTAENIIDTSQRHVEANKDRRSKKLAETMNDKIAAKEQQGEPYRSKFEFWDDPENAGLRANLNAKEERALENRVAPPKESKSEALVKVGEAMSQNKFVGMPSADFESEYMVNLSKADQNTYRGIWRKYNTESSADERQSLNFMGNILEKELVKQGKISKDFGHYDAKEDKLRADLYLQIVQAQDQLPKKSTPDQQLQFVRGIISGTLKDKMFNPNPKPPAALDPGLPKTSPSTTPIPERPKMTTADKVYWLGKWKTVKGSSFNPKADTAKDFQDFIDSGGK